MFQIFDQINSELICFEDLHQVVKRFYPSVANIKGPLKLETLERKLANRNLFINRANIFEKNKDANEIYN
jgi:hypothetical protein